MRRAARYASSTCRQRRRTGCWAGRPDIQCRKGWMRRLRGTRHISKKPKALGDEMGLKSSGLPLKGARLLETFEADDRRGRFSKFFDDALFRELGFTVHEVFASTNRKNVLRGLHFQNPKPQARIVWCLKGKIYDVLVDIRKNSPTFKKWHGIELSGE